MERKLLTNGTTSKNKNGRWNGSVWYMDEHGERKRKSFSADTQKEVKERIKSYIEHFYDKPEVKVDNASTKSLKESMQNWLEVFKYPSLQRTTYDRYEVTAEHQIYPYLGKKFVRDIRARISRR